MSIDSKAAQTVLDDDFLQVREGEVHVVVLNRAAGVITYRGGPCHTSHLWKSMSTSFGEYEYKFRPQV